MSSANFKLKRTAAASRGFLATAGFSCSFFQYAFVCTVQRYVKNHCVISQKYLTTAKDNQTLLGFLCANEHTRIISAWNFTPKFRAVVALKMVLKLKGLLFAAHCIIVSETGKCVMVWNADIMVAGLRPRERSGLTRRRLTIGWWHRHDAAADYLSAVTTPLSSWR